MEADQFKDLRKQAGLSQAKVAELLDSTQKTISNYECGKVSIPDGVADRLLIITDSPQTAQDKASEASSNVWIALRNEADMTQEVAADYLSINRLELDAYESGSMLPDDDVAERMRELYSKAAQANIESSMENAGDALADVISKKAPESSKDSEEDLEKESELPQIKQTDKDGKPLFDLDTFGAALMDSEYMKKMIAEMVDNADFRIDIDSFSTELQKCEGFSNYVKSLVTDTEYRIDTDSIIDSLMASERLSALFSSATVQVSEDTIVDAVINSERFTSYIDGRIEQALTNEHVLKNKPEVIATIRKDVLDSIDKAPEPQEPVTMPEPAESPSESITDASTFIERPNSLGEVIGFFVDQGFTASPENFYNYYAAQDWKTKAGGSFDWKTKARQWEKTEKTRTEEARARQGIRNIDWQEQVDTSAKVIGVDSGQYMHDTAARIVASGIHAGIVTKYSTLKNNDDYKDDVATVSNEQAECDVSILKALDDNDLYPDDRKRYDDGHIPVEYRGKHTRLGNLIGESALLYRRSAFLYGINGIGKTYSACAALTRIVNLQDRIIDFATAVRIENDCKDRFTVDVNNQTARDKYVSTPFLVIDELDKGIGVNENQDRMLCDIIETRFNNGKITIFTSNLSVSELLNIAKNKEAVKAIVSRLPQYCDVIHIESEDRRLS